ncbi:hypothetical protein B0I31_12443 [Saccharothrix carnea]|uniref:Uncharacterized protein n=1 Tax=Saccharothrix carnea TaxID=1280637 RepID=A0A2P8HR08_SACCR|nr:hypothetical protein [Saccharothrix carnea]PSL48656.1 hypothetical protein B0I31_12443 [Saccharothrix carnea]
MRLAGKEWRTLVSAVRLGGDSYRVIRPAHPIAHAALREHWTGAQLSVDRAATVDLAFAWWLAARSPHSLVYLPLRSGPSSCGEECGGRELDLVLLHHSLQFPVSRWKQVRARLSRSAVHKVTLGPEAFRAFGAEEHDRRNHREFQDHLRWSVAADTLFVIGSRRAYELEGDTVRELAEDYPARLAESPDRHFCAEIELGRLKLSNADARNPWSTLHVECCNRHW